MELPNRKTIRLKDYDYNMPGYYFITVCTKNKQKLLCNIVGTDLLGGPNVRFTARGKIVDNRLREMAHFYDYVQLDKYVIMPNHVHLILYIPDRGYKPPEKPEVKNSIIGKFVGTFKRFSNRECGMELWQDRSYDRVIRGEKDYRVIWEYMENNPARWAEDRFYIE